MSPAWICTRVSDWSNEAARRRSRRGAWRRSTRRGAGVEPGIDWQGRTRELMAAITDSIDGCLTGHQREVLVALALNGVPLDALADRLGTTRGALYKTLHDARRKLRADPAKRGLTLDAI